MLKNVHDYNEFLLEKRIDQISATVEITLAFDIIKTKHAGDRQNFSSRELDVDNQNFISNGELKEFVRYFKNEISKSIATGEIVDNDEFVIRSFDREMAMVIIARKEEDNYWKLVIKTVFRASHEEPFRTGANQLVFDK